MFCELRRAKSSDEVELILKDAEVFKRISEDDHSIDEFRIPYDGNQCYMMIYRGDTPIGVWCLYPANKTSLNIHCNILKQYRENAKEAGMLIIDWFVNAAPKQYVKLNAQIPEIYPDVYKFTKKFGFIDEGINRKSIRKDGACVDQWLLGLTKEEAVSFLAKVSKEAA